MKAKHRFLALFSAVTLVFLLAVASASGQGYTLVSSIPSNPTCQSFGPGVTISENGRWVFYESTCADLTPGVLSSPTQNIFGYDLITGETTLVNVAPNRRRAITARLLDASADGRYVIFSGGIWQTLGQPEPVGIFIRDLQAETTIQISNKADYFTRASISANGDTVAFDLDRKPTPHTEDTWVWSRSTGQTTLVNVPFLSSHRRGRAFSPKVSANGRYVLFESNSDGLVESDTNGSWDVFLRDTWTNTTALVSANRNGLASASGDSTLRIFARAFAGNNSSSVMSSDGRYVVFNSSAQDLLPGLQTGGLFVRDMLTGTTSLLNVNAENSGGFTAYEPLISADGQVASFWANYGKSDFGQTALPRVGFVFHRTLPVNQTSVLNWQFPNDPSLNYERCRNIAISADGRYELFTSTAHSSSSSSRDDLYLVDNLLGQTFPIGQVIGATGSASYANLSASGNVIVFTTTNKLVEADNDGARTDIYVYQLSVPAASVRKSIIE